MPWLCRDTRGRDLKFDEDAFSLVVAVLTLIYIANLSQMWKEKKRNANFEEELRAGEKRPREKVAQQTRKRSSPIQCFPLTLGGRGRCRFKREKQHFSKLIIQGKITQLNCSLSATAHPCLPSFCTNWFGSIEQSPHWFLKGLLVIYSLLICPSSTPISKADFSLFGVNEALFW